MYLKFWDPQKESGGGGGKPLRQPPVDLSDMSDRRKFFMLSYIIKCLKLRIM